MNITKWFKKTFSRTVRCSMCHRPLTNKKDRARGIGATCLKTLENKNKTLTA